MLALDIPLRFRRPHRERSALPQFSRQTVRSRHRSTWLSDLIQLRLQQPRALEGCSGTISILWSFLAPWIFSPPFLAGGETVMLMRWCEGSWIGFCCMARCVQMALACWCRIALGCEYRDRYACEYPLHRHHQLYSSRIIGVTFCIDEYARALVFGYNEENESASFEVAVSVAESLLWNRFALPDLQKHSYVRVETNSIRAHRCTCLNNRSTRTKNAIDCASRTNRHQFVKHSSRYSLPHTARALH